MVVVIMVLVVVIVVMVMVVVVEDGVRTRSRVTKLSIFARSDRS